MNGTTFPPHEFGDSEFSNSGGNNEQRSYQGGQNGYQGGQNSQGGQGGGSWKERNQAGGQQNNQGGQGGGNRSWGSGGGGQSGYQKKPWNGGQGGGGGGVGFQKRPEDTDMTLYKPYACTANEDAPPEIKNKFIEIVKMLENNGYTLRTGGMEGVEEIVENSVTKKEVHLPWREFAGKQSRFTFNSDRAYAIAKKYHPTFDGLSKGVKCFLAKNARLVLGNNMTSPALFLLTWTEDGATSSRDRTARTGFAGHPIAIAAGIGIPVINLARSDAEQKLNMLITNEM
jgi:hypothetical protein